MTSSKELFLEKLSQNLNTWLNAPQRFLRREILPLLADLRLAILLLLSIGLFSISGTVIEQGQSVEYYQSNYPEHPALFGFLTWKVLLILGLDHVYRTWWFLAILILFGSSLTACTFTRQLPTLKAAKYWKFYDQPQQYEKLALSSQLDQVSLETIEPLLQKKRYQVFREGDKMYARKGMMGRVGPIIVHASMLLILAGSIWGSITGFMAQELIPSGDTFRIKNIIDAGMWSESQIPKDWSVKVNRFWIDYTPDGVVDQFYSDLSILDNQGQEIDRKTIHVNEPLKYQGITLYQSSWSIAAVRVKVNKSPILQLPMVELNTNGNGKIWGTWIPTKTDLSEGVSLLAKDLQGTVLIYDTQGKLATTLRGGMSTEINGVTLKLEEIVGSTGLQIKADPGIPLVYTGFGLLMISVLMSYVSHSQIWVLKKGEQIYIGGKTNRAQLSFEREVIDLIESCKNN